MYIKHAYGKMTGFLKRYWREIAYYVCVMLVLGAIAWGAENYRMRRVKVEDIPLTVSADAMEIQDEARFVIPEGMTVCGEFSVQPVWNAEHGCWQAHPAVDFACTDGKVCSIGGGVVKTVGESGVYGGFIEIEDGEILLRYCSVAPKDNLLIGAEVEMGEFIGIADDSMLGEMHMGAHTHVEAVCDAEMMNILEIGETSD